MKAFKILLTVLSVISVIVAIVSLINPDRIIILLQKYGLIDPEEIGEENY